MTADKINIENIQANIVVIGGGGAGLAAAVTAAEMGVKDIVVLEKRRTPGGNSLFPGGLLAAESNLQKANSIYVSRDDVFKKAMEYAHWKPNARLVRSLIDISGDNIKWLEGKGVKFVKLVPHYLNQILVTYHASSNTRRTGSLIIKALVKSCEELGVKILYQAAARKLLSDQKGRVNGVLATIGNKEMGIKTRSIIIATGGFAGNNELLKRYIPSYDENQIHLRGLPHKGDGLQLAAEAGAAIGGQITLEAEGPDFPGSDYVDIIAKVPNTVWVNKRGERFIDENSPSVNEVANALMEQPDKTSYTLFDEEIKQGIIRGDFSPLELFELSGINSETWQKRVDEEIQSQVKVGRIKIADTWKEIAGWMGADPEVLESTIEEYNNFRTRGHDEVMAKDRRFLTLLGNPPFYAVKCKIRLLVTHGGIRVSHNMEVYDKQYSPIPGLYAAGDDTGGRLGDTYNVYLSGISFCFAIGSGRLAGRSAAEYVLGK